MDGIGTWVVHFCRRLELLVGIAVSSGDGDLALLGEDSADGGSNIPGEACLRLDMFYGLKERRGMLARLHPRSPQRLLFAVRKHVEARQGSDPLLKDWGPASVRVLGIELLGTD